MTTRGILVLSILALPVIAEAQRSGGSGAPPIQNVRKNPRGDRANYNGLASSGGAFTISNKDVESLSPIKLLLDKKKALSLTEEQVTKLKALEVELKTENDTLYTQIDSLRKEMKSNPNAANPQVEQLRVRGARTAMVEVIRAVRASYDKAEPTALGLLDEAQQKTATELLDKHQQDGDEMLQEKLGGGRRGR